MVESGSADSDRRRNMRIPFRTAVRLTARGHTASICSDQTRDLSLKGLYCHTTTGLPVGTTCDVLLKMSGTSTELSLRMKGVVVRSDADGIAVLFQEMDIESLFHLRNIISYNSGDPDRIASELFSCAPEGEEGV